MLEELLHLRRSVRDYNDRYINNQIVDQILEAGRLAASGNNKQPWLFGAITDKEMIEQISDCAYGQKFIKSAPLVIVLSTDTSDTRQDLDLLKAKYPSMSSKIDAIDQQLLEKMYAKEHQTKIAGAQMILQALENGIGSCWVSYFNAECLGKILGLPENYTPTEIIVMGYPKEDIAPRSKKTFEEITFKNKFS